MKVIDDISENLNQGINECAEHSIKYPLSAVGDFVKDYWDMGCAICAGVAPFIDSFDDSTRVLTFLGGGLLAILGGGKNPTRVLRNCWAGVASWTASSVVLTNTPYNVGNSLASLATGAISLYCNKHIKSDPSNFEEN